MSEILFNNFDASCQRVENAINALRNKYGLILLDDKNRENEGDIIFAAETMKIEQMAFSIRFGSGIVCLCLTEDRRKQLDLPMMVKNNTSVFRTGFTVTIEAANGISTGVSAKDRLITIKTAIADNAKPRDLNRPGHVFPLVGSKNGVFSRSGHTEASLDLVKLANLKPASVLCELINDDGSIANFKEIINFAKKNSMPIVTTNDLIIYLKNNNIFSYKLNI